MTSQTPNKESQRLASEHLKRVDTFIKSREFDRAKDEIMKAVAADSTNRYAQAYLERVELLIEQQKQDREAAEVQRRAEEELKAKEEAERKRREQEEAARRKRLEEEQRKKKEEEQRKEKEEEHKRREEQKKEEEQKKKEEDRKRVEEQRKREEEHRRRGQEQHANLNHREEITAYNRALFEAWAAGVPSPQQQRQLDILRASLYISSDEHRELELAVRKECYVEAFQRLWSTEKILKGGASSITALRERYRVGVEEFDAIEMELLNQLKRPKQGPLILVVDDDPGTLDVVSAILQEEGYDARGFITSDEAYRFLIHTTPELILTDVNLETSTIGGFGFLEKIQELPRLSHVPFVFMSGITDEVIVRAGKEMGADDFIAKPFGSSKLLSIVRGKLRRYRELRSIASN